MGKRASRRDRAVALVLFALAATSCRSGGDGKVPLVSASTSLRAGRAMQVLRDSFQLESLRTPEKRETLVRAFMAYERDYKDDPAVALARVYLAFLEMAEGNLGRAKGYLRLLDEQPHGWVRDFADVANARFLRLTGNARGALAILAPLRGTFVDRQALSLFLEEISVSALAAGEEPYAIERISEWIAHAAPEEQEDVRARVEGLLSSLHTPALKAALEAVRTGKFQTSPDLARMMTERLATLAIETNDVRIARWLAESEARSEVSDVNARLHDLATREQETVRGRTIGLLLSTAHADLRDMAAESVRGVAWALGLPRSRLADQAEVKLVTRDDGGKVEATEAGLDELAGIGAAVIVAGLDEATAERSLAWAERTHVPVISLAEPKVGPKTRDYGFVVGEKIGPAIELLVDALVKDGKTKIAPIADDTHVPALGAVMSSRTNVTFFQPTPCESREEGPTLPKEEWEKRGFRTWLVAGTDRCARDMMRLLGSNSTHTFALALDAIGPEEAAPGVRRIAVGAGSLPVVGEPPADIAEFMKSFGGTPDWTTSLGRDAALLALRSISTLPVDETTSHDEVVARRGKMRDALLQARSRLWTSEESGFGQDHRIKRALRVVSFEDDKKNKKRR